MGDPCGIGPDIVLSAFAKHENLPDCILVGSRNVLQARADLMGISATFTDNLLHLDNGSSFPIIDTHTQPAGKAGEPLTSDAKATIEAIDMAVAMVYEDSASALVTCPINKKNLYEIGFQQPGHTEYLATLATHHGSDELHPVMMIAGPDLKTIPVTIHIPLKDAPSALTQDLIELTCRIAARDLQTRFGIHTPHLAVSGLNPHAGEESTLGKEDAMIIQPAIEALQLEGLNVSGPYPADTMFHPSARNNYDVAICMYHDQALIPAKTLAFDEGVNVTLGLPFIRTSPDHGTAYDIAGTGKANPDSLVAAIRMAHTMALA